jgi:hypothetical protein
MMDAVPMARHEAGVLQPASAWKSRIKMTVAGGRAHCAVGGAIGDIIILDRSGSDMSRRGLNLRVAGRGQALASRYTDEEGCRSLPGSATS